MHSENRIAQFISKRMLVIALTRQESLNADIHFIPRLNRSLANALRSSLAIFARRVSAIK